MTSKSIIYLPDVLHCYHNHIHSIPAFILYCFPMQCIGIIFRPSSRGLSRRSEPLMEITDDFPRTAS